MKVFSHAQNYAINQLNKVQKELALNVKNLSSGTKLDNASQESQVVLLRNSENSLHQVAQHLSQGVSYLQVIASAMNGVASLLTRMKELASQGDSETVNDSERSLIDLELAQLQEEMDRIAETTRYNNEQLTNGTGRVLSVLAGDKVNSYIDLDFSKFDLTTKQLGVSRLSSSDVSESINSLESIDEALVKLGGQRAQASAMASRLHFAVENNSTQSLNLAGARAKIENLDYAKEVVEFTTNNIKAQAATSVLSQSNFNKANVLKLLN